ncbi:hypothetical protein CAPTEDRAFT_219772 [Capitella teleta]|uniref:Major facilitator superfamily (MFS) profile domain-containing protein n=1 Tax=Capitella teleta TaxID=283909 RepID=R7V6Q5_CAPTE|nr:hypothetical protein CAPTEDRAFT_219772 [Capitella teleta]|eukprot:ELU12051.1 hypothetical protein CAPTEDRAFT_219772 [Capitella teleta]
MEVVNRRDGGWGWVVVASSFYANLVIGLILSGFSILYVEWLDVFGSDSPTGDIAWIGSINLCSGNLLGLLFGVLVDVWGCRVVALIGAVAHTLGFLASACAPSVGVLYVTFGVLAGIGSGLTMLTCNVIVLQHFEERKALASAISLSGVSFGTLIAGPFFNVLIEAYGWRGCLMILAGLTLNLFPVALTYRPCTRRARTESNTLIKQRLKSRLCKMSLFRKPTFILCLFGNLFMALGHFPVYSHTPNRAVHYGIGRSNAALLLMYLGATALVSRLIFGCVANLPGVNRIMQYAGGIMVAGGLQIVYAFTTTYFAMAISLASIGFVVGSFLTVQSTVLVDLVGIELLPKAQGALFTVIGSGSLLGTPLAGYLFDATGRYDVPFLVSGSLEIVGSVFILATVAFKKSENVQAQELYVDI